MSSEHDANFCYKMLLRFDFSVIDPQKGFTSRCNGMFMQSDMNMIIVPREISKTA